MARTITLSKATIKSIIIDPLEQIISVQYELLDETEKFREPNHIVYVRELPVVNGQPVPNSDRHYVVLTPAQFDYVVTLYQAILAEVNSRI